MQQFSLMDLSIDLFESAVHVLGEKLAHHQEHFWLYIQLWYNAPILLQYQCIVPKLYIRSKVLLMMGEFVARNMQSRFQ